jgi:hypothetical protein
LTIKFTLDTFLESLWCRNTHQREQETYYY